jgi:hypothetical protein
MNGSAGEQQSGESHKFVISTGATRSGEICGSLPNVTADSLDIPPQKFNTELNPKTS